MRVMSPPPALCNLSVCTVVKLCTLCVLALGVLDAVVAVTVMHVLFVVLRVCLLRECVGARLTAVLVWGMDEVWLW